MAEPPLFQNLFLGVGAMKAGTTWLYHVLGTHPDLFFCLEKETHYFYHCYRDTNLLSPPKRMANARDRYLRILPDRHAIGWVRNRLHWTANYLDNPVDDIWYKNLFCFQGAERYACDFSNLYALLPAHAWPKIQSRTNNLRVLYTLRDPLERLWSHVKFHLQITGEGDRLLEWDAQAFERFARQPFIWENFEYSKALAKLQTELDADSLHLQFFEGMRARPREELRKVEAFLGVSAENYSDDLLHKQVNEGPAHTMPSFFAEIFARDVDAEMNALERLGLSLPASWGVKA